MYTANNSKELKKLIKGDKFPIIVTDEKTKETIRLLEALKSKGILSTAKDEIKKAIITYFSYVTTMNVISEPTLIVIVGLSLTTLIALYALYKEKNIKVCYNEDGSITIETF